MCYPLNSVTTNRELWLPLGNISNQRYISRTIHPLEDAAFIETMQKFRAIYAKEQDALDELNNYIDKIKQEYEERQQPFYYWTPVTEVEA